MEESSYIKLLPCPFCGNKAEKRIRNGASDYDWNNVVTVEVRQNLNKLIGYNVPQVWLDF